MSATWTCPGGRTLEEFAAGRLDEAEARHLREHLRACPLCRDLLVDLESTAETSTNLEGGAGFDTVSEVTQAPSLPLLGEEDDDGFELAFLLPSSTGRSLGRVGDYEVLTILGRGGMGVVYKAFDESLNRAVAIKALAPRLANSPKARRRFVREARAAAAINHPNVVTIHGVGQQRGMPYLVMEYISGQSLRQRMREGPPLEPADVLRIGGQVATGLAAAHEQGVIHRDIKPANIMLEGGIERVKIADFGLAVAAEITPQVTSADRMVGTPAYMSPEQVRGSLVDPRSDLFSLGCVMYAMIEGRSPFQGGGQLLEVIRKVSDLEPTPLHELDPDIPRGVSDLVDRLLRKDPKDRFQSAAELAAAINQLLAWGDSASAEVIGAKRPRRPRRRRPALLAFATLALMLAALACGLPAWRRAEAARRAAEAARASALIPTPEPAPTRTRRVLAVAPSGGAQFRKISQALDKAGPGDTIRLASGATYEEAVLINDPARWRGITIDGQGATLTSARGLDAVLTIKDTPGVIIRDLRIDARAMKRHAIQVKGDAEGLVIEGVEFVSPPDSVCAQLHIKDGRGTDRGPIRVSRSVFHINDGGFGIIAGGEVKSPVSFVDIEDNRFEGGRRQVQLLQAVDHIRLRANTFVGGRGVLLNLKQPSRSRDVLIANNTFFGIRTWIEPGESSPDQDRIEVANNLILGSDWDQSVYENLARMAPTWSFHHNWWEAEPALRPGEGALVAELSPRIDVLSRGAESPDFLKPAPTSPMATSGADGELPRYVGARDPVAAAPPHPSPDNPKR